MRLTEWSRKVLDEKQDLMLVGLFRQLKGKLLHFVQKDEIDCFFLLFGEKNTCHLAKQATSGRSSKCDREGESGGKIQKLHFFLQGWLSRVAIKCNDLNHLTLFYILLGEILIQI